MYQVVIGLLFVGAFFEFNYHKKSKLLYYIILAILIIISAFRYGLMTDYFNYMHVFNTAPINGISWNYLKLHDTVSEIGYRLICNCFKILGVNYYQFTALLSIFLMIGIHKVISKKTPYSIIGLLVFFPTYFNSYICGMSRQAIVIVIFLLFMIEMIEKKQWKKYIVLCILCVLIHKASVLYFVLPFLVRISKKMLIKCIPIVFIINIIIDNNSEKFNNIFDTQYFNTSMSILGVLERTLFLILILLLLNQIENTEISINLYLKLYIVGYLISILFASCSFIGQRFTVPLKIIEIVLVPYSLENCKTKINFFMSKRKKILCFLAIYCLCMVACYKNFNTYIKWQKFDNVSEFNFPYISIFNQKKYYELGGNNRYLGID